MSTPHPTTSPRKRIRGNILLIAFSGFIFCINVLFWWAAYENLAGPYCDHHLMHAGETCSRLHVRGGRGGYTQEHLNHVDDAPVKLRLPADFHPAPDDTYNGVYTRAHIGEIHHGDGLEYLVGGVGCTTAVAVCVHRFVRRHRGGVPPEDPDDNSAWKQLPRGAGRRGRKAVTAGLLPAESAHRHGWRAAGIFFTTLAAAVGACVVTRGLLGDIGCPDFPALTAAAFAPVAVIVAVVAGNRKLSRWHRIRMSQRAVTAAGEIIDCTTFSTIRSGSSTSNYFVDLTVRFADPEYPEPPQWIRRGYLFPELPTTAARFAIKYAAGVTVTVRRNVRFRWYGLDVDDDHLIWGQWW